MPLVETKRDTTTSERKGLALTVCALGVVVALMIWFKPASLLLITGVSGIAWCASMLFNKDEPPGRQWKGVIVPVISSLLSVTAAYVAPPATIAVAAAVALVVLGIVTWFRERFGSKFYKTWSLMFLPLAWSVSTLLLVLVYYVVLTPIGLTLRLAGRDPLRRKFDHERTTYWVKREATADLERYFRQF